MAALVDSGDEAGSELLAKPQAHETDIVDIDPEDEAYTKSGVIGRELRHSNPQQNFLLGPFSVFFIVANRMIGSGIFLTPSTLITLTQSVGISLLFWLAGAITTLCGTMMFIEYGLSSPRYRFDGKKEPLPRSGGDMYYLKDIFKRPGYLAVCTYGIAFFLLGNVATNSMAFGVRVLQAADMPADNGWAARGIALGVITFTCLLHGVWRMGGIWLSNVFAFVKLAMLLFIFITGCLSWGGVFPRNQDSLANMTAANTFKDPSTDAYAFAEAYLAIVFAYGGFNQANYVLGEVDNPRRNYKWPAFFSVLSVCILYLLVNIAYMLVVPAESQKAGVDVASEFFRLTYGSLSPTAEKLAPRVLAAFMAVSALGNLIVMTYTAARVKQEIAKEGILPFRKFLANNYPSSSASDESSRKPLFGFMRGNPVPVGALFLHWLISVMLVLCTAKISAYDAYKILVSLYSYTIDAIFGVLLGVGIWVLRFRPGGSFPEAAFKRPWMSLGAATVYALSMAFPIVASWVPPSAAYLAHHPNKFPWFATATVSWSCLALGVLWWVGFAKIGPRNNRGEQNVIRRRLLLREIPSAKGKSSYFVLDHEVLQFRKLQCDPGAPRFHEDATMRMSTRITESNSPYNV